MEALSFSFLKFWKNLATTHGGDATKNPTEITHYPSFETDNEVDEEDSFFELELTVPDCDNDEDRDNPADNKHNDGETFDFREHPFKDPSKKIGDKRRILPIEPNSKPQSPISILKSAPKFRVLMFGFKKSKTEKTGKTEPKSVFMATPKHAQQENKLFAVKFKVEEAPVVSMFTRGNSVRDVGSTLQKQSSEDDFSKRFSKDVVQKYLKLIKPLYVKVSKRYNEKVGLSDVFSTASPVSSPASAPVSSPKKAMKTTWKKEEAGEKQGNIPAGLRVVCKHLGKSRSASAAVGVVVPPPASRRDDSLLQQHDGIQSAILHCKRSFNSSREPSLLSRSTSDFCGEKSMDSLRKSIEEDN
ncbi:hypothetical protein L1049_019676 [Liquidambar formosana]|uniref:Membrane-associated kinase regulator 2 n=1 Tax=Liquidambar formosana TaxID=63359 RepID=A0AAP0X6P8_LIQFO